MANPSNHIMCADCWAHGFIEEGRAAGKPSLPSYRTVGACCYCDAATDDGIPAGDPDATIPVNFCEMCGRESEQTPCEACIAALPAGDGSDYEGPF